MPTITCPKCGISQEKDLECRHCGVIFARLHNGTLPPRPISCQPCPEPAVPPGPGFWFHFRRFYRVSRVVVPAVLILVAGLILHASTPPQIPISADSAQRAQAKVEQFKSGAHRGRRDELSMNESELNGWLSKNLALQQTENAPVQRPAKKQGAKASPARPATSSKPDESAAAARVASSIREVKIELLEHSLRVYTAFDFHGLELSLELEGQPVVQDGYLRLSITNGKLGSLPLPAATLRSATNRIFDAPDNREKFHLPPEIRDIRVEQGQIIVFPR